MVGSAGQGAVQAVAGPHRPGRELLAVKDREQPPATPDRQVDGGGDPPAGAEAHIGAAAPGALPRPGRGRGDDLGRAREGAGLGLDQPPGHLGLAARDPALAATAGWASRASIDSRPWMVDSAPELRLTVRSGLMPSKVRPVAGSYMATPAGLLPKNQAPATPARSAKAGRRAAAAVRSRFWRVASAP